MHPWHIKEIKFYPESFSHLPKHCAYCGLSLDQFVVYGKFGCEYCVDFLKQHAFIYERALSRIPDQIFEIPESYLSETRNKFQSLKHDDHKPLFVSTRYRIARNFKKHIFPFFRKDTNYEESVLTRSFDLLGKFSNLSPHIRFANLINERDWQGNFILGDEDGIRFELIHKQEIYLQKGRSSWVSFHFPGKFHKLLHFLRNPNLFCHRMDWGYLNSCPTNAKRADRISIQLSTSATKVDWDSVSEERNWDLGFEENGIRFAGKELKNLELSLTFSVKNFTRKRKNHFLSSVNSIVL